VADGASSSDAVDANKGPVPGASKSESNILSADIPLWATGEVSAGDRSHTNARERLDQFGSRTGGSSLRDAAAVKERLSRSKQRIAAGHASLLEPLLTVGETAAILNVSARTIRRLIASGAIPAVSIGRSVRLRPRDIGRLIAEGGVCND
jgi:excisionase family DNA binding protein